MSATKVTPAQRVLLDAAARGPVRPTTRQRKSALALASCGWLALKDDGLSYSITELGREAHTRLLGPSTHREYLLTNWARAHNARKARLGNV